MTPCEVDASLHGAAVSGASAMTAWALVLVLYGVGCVGHHAMARDLQRKPIRTRRAWINILLWPLTVSYGKAGDIYDHITAKR
jgi:hypothetical protein